MRTLKIVFVTLAVAKVAKEVHDFLLLDDADPRRRLERKLRECQARYVTEPEPRSTRREEPDDEDYAAYEAFDFASLESEMSAGRNGADE